MWQMLITLQIVHQHYNILKNCDYGASVMLPDCHHLKASFPPNTLVEYEILCVVCIIYQQPMFCCKWPWNLLLWAPQSYLGSLDNLEELKKIFAKLCLHKVNWKNAFLGNKPAFKKTPCTVTSCIYFIFKSSIKINEGYTLGYWHNMVIPIVPIMLTYLWQYCTKNGENMENEKQGQWPSNICLMECSLYCWHRYKKFIGTMVITRLWQ